MSITVFPAEREAGLEDLIRANASIALLADAGIAEPFIVSESSKANFLAKADNKKQIDLHYLRSIMVTAGWNRNDDVFEGAEMWMAKSTPEDKPFNLEHNQADIIGHITGSVAVDDNLVPILDETPVDQLPTPYHIVTTAVLYKIWEDPELQSRMDKMIVEIAQGKWFVSMEALFHGFDYSIKSAKGTQIVARNDKTAFLTKHLRAYGGNGTYEGAQVGRVLRQITFSGKGLVRKPANPGSVILDAHKASGYEVPREECFEMVDIENEVTQAKEKAAKLEVELAAASEELSQLKAERRHAHLAASAAETLGDGSEAIASVLAQLGDDQFVVAVAAINDYLSAKIAAYKDAESRAQNAQKVDTDIKAVAEDLKSILQQIKDAVSKSPKEKDKEEEEAEAEVKGIKKMPLVKKPLPPEAAQVVTGSVLNNVIPSEEPALAASAVDQSVNKVAAQIAAFFGADETEEPAAE